MAKAKKVLDDVGSVVLRELVRQVNTLEVKTTAVTTGAIVNTATGSVIMLLSDRALVVTDVLLSNPNAAIVGANTDLFVEHDTDQAFGSATIVLDVQGFDGVGNSWATKVLTLASDMVGKAVATQTFPFTLPAGSALRLRVINNEGGDRTFYASVLYHPKDDTLEIVPVAPVGKVLSEADRAL